MVFSIDSSLLEAVVLSVISERDIYGYKITQIIGCSTEVSDSTLYPVLKRLQKKGFLESYHTECDGRNRRYYTITKNGESQLILYRDEWTMFKNSIDGIFNRANIHLCNR